MRQSSRPILIIMDSALGRALINRGSYASSTLVRNRAYCGLKPDIASGPKLLNGDELQHLTLRGLVSAFVGAMPHTLLSLLKAAFPIQTR